MDAAGLVDAGLLARAAGLLADRSRAAFCLALLDGRAWTAVELARHVGVAASTASEHLSTLVAAGLLAEERQGRHRYLRLAGPGVAPAARGHRRAHRGAGRPAIAARRAGGGSAGCRPHLL